MATMALASYEDPTGPFPLKNLKDAKAYQRKICADLKERAAFVSELFSLHIDSFVSWYKLQR
jgi:hypothetical protein